MNLIELDRQIQSTIDLIKLYRFYNKTEKSVSFAYNDINEGSYIVGKLIQECKESIDIMIIYSNIIMITIANKEELAYCNVIDRRVK